MKNQRRGLIAAGTLAVVCAGCLGLITPPPVNWNAANAPAMQVQVTRDEFLKTVRYQGPNCTTKSFSQLFLRAIMVRGGTPLYGVYVQDMYLEDGWRMYDRADDDQGNQLPVSVIARNVNTCDAYSCFKEEHLIIKVTKDYLLQHQGSGLRFQISSSRGAEVYEMPGGYIRAFLVQIRC